MGYRGRERPRRLWYLHSPNRLRPVGAGKQLGLDLEPMVFEVKRQILDAHVVDAGRSPCLRSGKLLMAVDFAVHGPLVRPGRPHIRFLFVGPRVCSMLPLDPASRRRRCALLTLLRHQDG